MKYPTDAITAHIGNRITDALTQRGMTQSQLADRTGLTASAISQLISGKKQDIKVSTLIRISNELQVPFDYLLSGDQRVTDKEIRTIMAAYKGATDSDQLAVRAILHKYDNSIEV